MIIFQIQLKIYDFILARLQVYVLRALSASSLQSTSISNSSPLFFSSIPIIVLFLHFFLFFFFGVRWGWGGWLPKIFFYLGAILMNNIDMIFFHYHLYHCLGTSHFGYANRTFTVRSRCVIKIYMLMVTTSDLRQTYMYARDKWGRLTSFVHAKSCCYLTGSSSEVATAACVFRSRKETVVLVVHVLKQPCLTEVFFSFFNYFFPMEIITTYLQEYKHTNS